MKNMTVSLRKFKLLLAAAFLGLSLSSCNQSKSTKTPDSSGLVINGKTILATCTKATSTNLSVNLATIEDQVGQIDPIWIKLRFNVIHPNLLKAGNTMRIYRVKAGSGTPTSDPVSLYSQTYDPASGQANSNIMQVVNPQVLNSFKSFYVKLDDMKMEYQALQIAFFDTTGANIENFKVLIPEFLAVPSEYSTQSDGTARSSFLKDLHPLKDQATTGWTADTYYEYFEKSCF